MSEFGATGLQDRQGERGSERRPDIGLLPGFLEEAKERWRGKGLTIAEKSDAVVEAFLSSDRFILEALPGSGKTTVAPVEFLRALLDTNPNARIVVTEPQKLAVESLAEYVGSETSKDFVDFHHREHPARKPDSRLLFTVEQSLRNELVRTPALDGVDCVVLDEIHTTDTILLGLLKEAQKLRKAQGVKQLKLVLTSGTVDVESFRAYLDDETAEVKTLTVEGHKHEINEYFSDAPVSPDQAPTAAADTVKKILSNKDSTSDILIFMPGEREITKTEEALAPVLAGQNIEVVTLMGGDRVGNPYAKINNNPGNKRRVYIATDVAEKAITIPNVDVIDSGLMKKMVYDPKTRLSTLVTLPHTKENYTQRKGRAGRTGTGNYHALFTSAELASRADRPVPEFLQKDVTSDVLWLRASGKDIYGFDFKDRPAKEVLDQAVVSLQKLGALDSDGNITQIGKEMADMDEEPNHARMLVEAKKRGCLSAVALVIGALKTKGSIFQLSGSETFSSKYAKFIDPNSDFITFLKAWNGSIKTQGEGFDKAVLASIKRERNKLKQGSSSVDVEGVQLETQEQIEAINLSIASGIADRKIVGNGGVYKYEGAIYSGVKLDKKSVFYGKRDGELLSGRINSNKKGDRMTSHSEWNMEFNPEMLAGEFEYLREFFNVKPEEEKQPEVVEKKPDEEVPEARPVEASQVQDISNRVENAPTAAVKEEAMTFIGKVRENWHNLTDKVKELYIRFKNMVKKVFKI